MTLEMLIGAIGIIVFALTFIGGLLAVSRQDKSR